jgi:hypothetical protein
MSRSSESLGGVIGFAECRTNRGRVTWRRCNGPPSQLSYINHTAASNDGLKQHIITAVASTKHHSISCNETCCQVWLTLRSLLEQHSAFLMTFRLTSTCCR